MKRDQPSGNFAGSTLPITPKDGGARILGKRFQDAVVKILNSWLKIQVVQTYSDGSNIYNSKPADVQMTENGTIITLPPAQVVFPGNSSTTGGGGGGGGTGNYAGTWSAGNAYLKGQIVRVTQSVIYNTNDSRVVASVVGVYGCILATAPQGGAFVDYNQIPQFPEPAQQFANPGITYWELIALGTQPISVCQGGTETIYIHASTPF